MTTGKLIRQRKFIEHLQITCTFTESKMDINFLTDYISPKNY